MPKQQLAIAETSIARSYLTFLTKKPVLRKRIVIAAAVNVDNL